MLKKSTKHKDALHPSENIELDHRTGKATGWRMPKPTKPKDALRPPKKVVRDPKPRKPALVKPKARSTTVPQKSTKLKDDSKLLERLELARDSEGSPAFVKSKAPRTTITSSLTKHKDAPRPPKEAARDPKQRKPVPARPKARSTTMAPESREKGDPIESLKPALDCITMQSKGYDKSNGRATRRDHADITTEGSDAEEAAGPEAVEREDTDDEDTDDGNTDDEHTDDGDTDEGWPIDRVTDNGHTIHGDTDDGYTDYGDTDDGYTDDEDTDEEEVIEVRTGGRGSAGGGSAERGPDGGRDGGQHADYRIDVVEEVSEAHAARRDDARGYPDGRGVPTRESDRRDLHGRELVRRDHVFRGDDDSPAPERPGSPRRVVDEGQHPGGQHHGGQSYGEQHRGGQHRGGQGYQGQGYHGQDYHGQAHSGQVGQGRGDPPPAYTRYDQRYIGVNSYY